MPAKPKRPILKIQDGSNAADIKRREKAFEKELAAYEKQRAAWQRGIDRQYETQLSALERMGIYTPKSHEMTEYRRARVRAAYREYSEYMAGDYAYVALPGNQSIREARGLQFKTTRKGAFVPLEGHKKATVRHTSSGYVIDLSGKVKRGRTGGTRTTKKERIPLRSLDVIANEEERLRREFDEMGPLTGRERMAFQLTEFAPEGYSKKIFGDINGLLDYLQTYEKVHPWKQQQLFRSVRLIKTESARAYYAEHPGGRSSFKRKKVNLKGRNQ